MAAAGVVVANPVVAPRSDVKIPAVQLSAGSGEDMLDQSFLDAIAPAPPESTNPFSVLRQLISSLAADATYLGKNAIVDAFVAGVTAVTGPELTATSTPFNPPLVKSPELAASLLPGLDLSAAGPFGDFSANLPDVSAPVTGAVAPVVQTLVHNVVSDAGFVGGQLFAAAFAAGAVVAAEPALIGDTLQALISGDLTGALQTAVKAVTVTFEPSVIILNALRTVVEKTLGNVTAALAGVAPALTATAVPQTEAPLPVLTLPAPAPASPLAEATRAGRGTPRGTAAPVDKPAMPETILAAPQPAAAVTSASTRSRMEIPADLAQISVDPVSSAPRPSPRDTVEAVGKQLGAAVATATSRVDNGGARARAGRTAK